MHSFFIEKIIVPNVFDKIFQINTNPSRIQARAAIHNKINTYISIYWIYKYS